MIAGISFFAISQFKELLKAADKNLYEEKTIKYALRDAVKK